MKTLFRTAVVATVVALTAPAQALPTTYVFTGTLDSEFSIFTSGSLAGVFSTGQTFTLTTVFDDDGPADFSEFNPVASRQQWHGGSTTLSIGGNDYTVGPSTGGVTSVEAYTDTFDQSVLTLYGFDSSATTTNPSVDTIELFTQLYESDPGFDPVSFIDPRMPGSLSLTNWSQGVDWYFEDYDSGGGFLGLAHIQGNTTTLFDSVEVFVPAPGAFALLGFGLVGVAAASRRTAQHPTNVA